MSHEELAYLPATEALALFRSRALSPVELLGAQIARSEALNPRLIAFTTTRYEQAMAAAREAERRYAPGADPGPRPLEGLPLAVKDLHSIDGEITTHGSLLFARSRDEGTMIMVERLLGAGAVLVARTAVPEFGASTITRSRLWGPSRNPWNLDKNPGGSGGGAGAALAAGMTTLADGSDYGGSIRIPASCCGVVGYKPPRGRNPVDAGPNFDPCLHLGPLGRSVADVALMQSVISGPDRRDIASLPGRLALPERFEPAAGLRVAWSMDLGYAAVDEEVQGAVRSALDALRGLGCEVEPVELPWTERVHDAYDAYHCAEVASTLSALLPARDQLCDYLVEQIDRGRRMSACELFAVNEVRAEMWASLGPILARCDLLVCPTTGLPAVDADQSPLDKVSIHGRSVPAHLAWVLTYPFNLLSPCPAMSVPCGRSRDGVPIGLQLVGRPYDDLTVFRVASALEAQNPWFRDRRWRPELPDAAPG